MNFINLIDQKSPGGDIDVFIFFKNVFPYFYFAHTFHESHARNRNKTRVQFIKRACMRFKNNKHMPPPGLRANDMFRTENLKFRTFDLTRDLPVFTTGLI